MKATAEAESVITLTIELSEEEAGRLKAMMQNPLSENEHPMDNRIREWIFTTLDKVDV